MSNNVYDRIFARFYDTFMEKPEKVELARRRRRLLRDLKGNILEIGAGTGASFQWYGPAAHVLAVEPS
ncbi:MAG TPA: class I SAM-dependent methyltransferase [Leptospiraceae bacterium]|nr:class I SAM-dependent methyltransferase [Leptospiraceae bacterium]